MARDATASKRPNQKRQEDAGCAVKTASNNIFGSSIKNQMTMFARTRTSRHSNSDMIERTVAIGNDQPLVLRVKVNINDHVRLKLATRNQNPARRRPRFDRETNRRCGAGCPAEQRTGKGHQGKKGDVLRAFPRVEHIPSSFKPRMGCGDSGLETCGQSCPHSACLSIGVTSPFHSLTF